LSTSPEQKKRCAIRSLVLATIKTVVDGVPEEDQGEILDLLEELLAVVDVGLPVTPRLVLAGLGRYDETLAPLPGRRSPPPPAETHSASAP
jgi:hypothetical protein